MTTKLTSLSLLLLLGFVWGTGYSIARFATTHGVPPLGYSFWQSLGPALLITFVCCMKKRTAATSTASLKYYLICGITGIVIPNTNMYFAAPHLPAGLLAVIVNTVPIIVYPLSLLIKIEQWNWSRVAGIGFAICGLLFIVLPKTSLPSHAMIPWVLMALITPCSFAICAVYIARFRPEHSDSLTLAAGTLIASSLLLFPLVLFSGNFYCLHLPLTVADDVILLEIVLSSMGYFLLFQLLKISGPVYYSLVDTIVALTGLFWGYILFQERLNEWTTAAIFFIFMALLLVTQKQQMGIKPNISPMKDKMI